jgi:hypothetical protein
LVFVLESLKSSASTFRVRNQGKNRTLAKTARMRRPKNHSTTKAVPPALPRGQRQEAQEDKGSSRGDPPAKIDKLDRAEKRDPKAVPPDLPSNGDEAPFGGPPYFRRRRMLSTESVLGLPGHACSRSRQQWAHSLTLASAHATSRFHAKTISHHCDRDFNGQRHESVSGSTPSASL